MNSTKIAYLTSYDTLDSASWPKRHLGSYSASRVIRKSLDIDFTLLRSPDPSYPLISKWDYIVAKNFQEKYYKWCKKPLNSYFIEGDYDYILCPENYIPLMSLETSIPTILWTDCLIGCLVDYYPYLCNLSYDCKQSILEQEKLVVDRCQKIILNSNWSKEQAIKLYNLPESKIEVMQRPVERQDIIIKASDGLFRMLFVGLDWYRKGGDEAIEIATTLYNLGFNIEISLVGDIPDKGYPHFINPIGFVNKHKLNQLYQESNLLINCSRQDVLPTVLAQAQSYKTPTISRIAGASKEVSDMHYSSKEEAIQKIYNYILLDSKPQVKIPLYTNQIQNKFKEIIHG